MQSDNQPPLEDKYTHIKNLCMTVASIFRNSQHPELHKRADRIEMCADYLIEDSTGRMRLWRACGQGMCPSCHGRPWQVRQKHQQAARQAARIYPDGQFLAATLTVESPPVTELGSTIKRMHDSVSHMLRRDPFRNLHGYLRATEVSADGFLPQPHMHLLLLAKANQNVTETELREKWAAATRMEYELRVQLKPLKPLSESDDLERWLSYISKPPVQGIENILFDNPRLVEELAHQVNGSRMFSAGGCFPSLRGKGSAAETPQQGLYDLQWWDGQYRQRRELVRMVA